MWLEVACAWLQALSRVLPLRNFFLLPHNYSSCKSVLVQRFGALLRKMWNPRQFKGQVGVSDRRRTCMLRVILDTAGSAGPEPIRCSHSKCVARELLQPHASFSMRYCIPQRPSHCVQVSPHEFMQQVMAASSKRFTIEKKSDPVEFLSWLLNTIHSDLTGGKRKKPSIISKCFQVRPAQYGSSTL